MLIMKIYGFVPAKNCKFDKNNFKKELERETGENIKIISEIQEDYYRIKKSSKDSWEEYEFGEYYYGKSKKGKGACLTYFAAFEYV